MAHTEIEHLDTTEYDPNCTLCVAEHAQQAAAAAQRAYQSARPARDAAEQLAHSSAHVHLIDAGHSTCLSGCAEIAPGPKWVAQ
ncbi:hypothetical protein [Streptomyces sp. WMMC897]|uniref:hypothetical protein n=1 Tax=Streptomyces sp. WMMC897 TaxID=3014782 RepID=UPI0022B63F38|nr:hypothetical protein [Streptomyces sp. WMMC897]MCZ7414288.1 hypothetical protein [Streptomyces sp. WMMC897]